MSHDNRYSVPDDRGQYKDQSYNSQPPMPQHASDNPHSYGADPSSYNEEPHYPSYPSDPSAGNYQAYASNEKMVEDGAYGQSTERAQPGRSGLRQPTRSFAEIGPPPRSTGILRMWRKDERGKQWLRVGLAWRYHELIIKGGGVRSCLRICCCCTTIAVIMVVSIILAILLVSR